MTQKHICQDVQQGASKASGAQRVQAAHRHSRCQAGGQLGSCKPSGFGQHAMTSWQQCRSLQPACHTFGRPPRMLRVLGSS
ncbi:hypothetical protein CVIRNUC_008376 [Coccomyxa viridis]|uniref:Uncharacterized protein n=1 Tax=Coccomyxa viridis TaxID=1274662 RepID=A0AAV1IFE3_9CHLO|nr:hypothetical protein CVIRNUC_008376 [Coccomyxa viridis]